MLNYNPTEAKAINLVNELLLFFTEVALCIILADSI